LKIQKLVEGRSPNIFVSASVADITGDRSSYIRNRAFDDDHYKKMIIAFIKKYKSASRRDIDDLLIDKLSDALNEKQKKNKIRNLIYEMSKKDKSIENISSAVKPKWILTSTQL